MKLILGRISSALATFAWAVLFGARLVLDLIGYSTAPEDVHVAQSRLDQLLGWLLSVPWWLLLAFAFASTLWLIWVSWPRHKHVENAAAEDRRFTPRPVGEPATRAKTPDPMDSREGDAHERLELFIIDCVLPACREQIELQKAIIKLICDNETVLRFAEVGLQRDYMNPEFCRSYDKLADLGGSPAPNLTVREMADSIVELESGSYKRFCEQADELAQAANVDYRRHASLAPMWESWRADHNHLVEEFDKLKRESRFGRPLYRPQRPSRWGGLVEPVSASG